MSNASLSPVEIDVNHNNPIQAPSVNYFDLELYSSDPERTGSESETYHSMATVTEWLDSDFRKSTPIPEQIKIFNRMTEIAETARALGCHRTYHTDVTYQTGRWISLLYIHFEHFWKHCEPSCRRLLNAVQDSYVPEFLVGYQGLLRDYDHPSIW